LDFDRDGDLDLFYLNHHIPSHHKIEFVTSEANETSSAGDQTIQKLMQENILHQSEKGWNQRAIHLGFLDLV